jgi:hypothetical protein
MDQSARLEIPGLSGPISESETNRGSPKKRGQGTRYRRKKEWDRKASLCSTRTSATRDFHVLENHDQIDSSNGTPDSVILSPASVVLNSCKVDQATVSTERV